MIDILLIIDNYVFQFINIYLNNSFLDPIFIFFHDCHKNLFFVIPLLCLWCFFIFKDKKKRLGLILLIPISIIITDQFGSYIKDFELRQRPYMSIDKKDINLLVEVAKIDNGDYKKTSSSQKSFPSNHSANIWAIALIIGHLYPNIKRYFVFLAIMVSISRVYIGVHYPIDIMTGAMIGMLVSLLLIKIHQKLIR